VRANDANRAQELAIKLIAFDSKCRSLPGINDRAKRECLVERFIESIRRIEYVRQIGEREISDCRADPFDVRFDPIKAAVLRLKQGQTDEAAWLIFLSVHFGKHRRTGWRLARDVYAGRGRTKIWDWARVSTRPKRFRRWLESQKDRLLSDGVARCFGSHRKYQSLDARTATGTGAAIETYIRWVNPPRTHQMLFEEAYAACGQNRKATFDYLYRSMDAVASFGRTARFDYLTMVGKVGLAAIEPGSSYLQGATGPLRGARLLFGGGRRFGPTELDNWLVQLEGGLNVGMQVMEDALCNWQKNPSQFRRFRG
jgi:hypothetical protein